MEGLVIPRTVGMFLESSSVLGGVPRIPLPGRKAASNMRANSIISVKRSSGRGAKARRTTASNVVGNSALSIDGGVIGPPPSESKGW